MFSVARLHQFLRPNCNDDKTKRRHTSWMTECCTVTSTWCVQVLRSPKEAFAAAMQSWRERCEKCVCLQGDYVEK